MRKFLGQTVPLGFANSSGWLILRGFTHSLRPLGPFPAATLEEIFMKARTSITAALGLLAALAWITLAPRFETASEPTRDDGLTRVAPVVASLSEIVVRHPVATARPDREGEGTSRIESRYSEAEILEMIAQAEAMPPNENVQILGESPAGLTFSAGVGFDSIEVTECCQTGNLNPPDPEIAVGRDHVIAVVNSSLEIYDKTGTSLVGPLDFETFFSSLGVGCVAFPFDPNVLYDESADRYVIGVDGNGSEYCVAASQTGDATGAYNFYAFPVNVNGEFFDYPHAGVGEDAIFVGANMFGAGTGRVFAFEKAAMYAGTPAASANHDTGSDDTPQPMNIKGPFPSDGIHSIVTSRSGASTLGFYTWEDPFGADVFTDVGSLDLAAVHGVSVGFGVGSQQMGGVSINSIGPRPQDFEYRDGFAWTTNLVSCNPGAGTVNCVQWAQIDVATASVAQAGVFATDGTHRIFSDLAVNACGDMMVGYTKTDSTIVPGVWIAGREAGDPAGTIQGEIEIQPGEIAFGESRWGDYTGMTMDPDGSTFWYLGEYSKNTATTRNWGTFVGSAQFDGCSPSSIFTDGFESGNTTSWSSTTP